MSERVTLVLDDGIGNMLTQLAGGERKRGAWLSDLVRGMHEQQQLAVATSDIEAIKFGFAGLAGQVKVLEGRLLQVEQRIATNKATD